MASLVPKASSEDPREFSDFVALLTEGLCADFPMYLHRVAMTFKAFDSIHDLHFVTMASFFSQLLLTDSIIEISLLGMYGTQYLCMYCSMYLNNNMVSNYWTPESSK